MRLLLWSLVIFQLSSCGRNDAPIVAGSNRSSDVRVINCNEGSFTVCKSGAWKVETHWNSGPKMGGEELLENSMCVTFHSASSGHIAEKIENVQVTAWMPSMAHDTGNEKPRVDSVKGGEAEIGNIWFIMTGEWEIIVRAQVDGVFDEARFSVDVVD